MNGFVTDFVNHFLALKGREPTYDEDRASRPLGRHGTI